MVHKHIYEKNKDVDKRNFNLLLTFHCTHNLNFLNLISCKRNISIYT